MKVKYLSDQNGEKFIPYGHTEGVFNKEKKSLEDILAGMKDHVSATYVVASDISVQKDGADFICDSEDDASIIQAAINRLPSLGGKIILLEGTYNFRSPIVVSQRTGVVIEGSGGGSTVLNFEGSGFTVRDTTCIIKDVAICGEGGELSTGIKSVDGAQCSLFNCDISRFDCCIDIDNDYWGAPCILHYVNCSNCTMGMKIRGAAQVSNCSIDGAVQILNGDIGCSITSSYIGYDGGITINGNDNRITGNYIYNSAYASENTAGVTISGTGNIVACNIISDTVGEVVCSNPSENTIGLNVFHLVEAV